MCYAESFLSTKALVEDTEDFKGISFMALIRLHSAAARSLEKFCSKAESRLAKLNVFDQPFSVFSL